jgi:hypothetical protein
LIFLFLLGLGFYLNRFSAFIGAARWASMVRLGRLAAFWAFLQIDFFESIMRPAASHFA